MRSHIYLISLGHKLQQEGEEEAEDKRQEGKGDNCMQRKRKGGRWGKEGQAHLLRGASSTWQRHKYILSLRSSLQFSKQECALSFSPHYLWGRQTGQRWPTPFDQRRETALKNGETYRVADPGPMKPVVFHSYSAGHCQNPLEECRGKGQSSSILLNISCYLFGTFQNTGIH